MKSIFITLIFCTSLLFAQFSTDVLVKQSGIVSYTDPDAACAANGNLFVAYLVDSAGIKGYQVSISTNYGISWNTTYSFMDPYQQVNDVAIATSGVGVDERVFVLIAYHNLISNLSTLNLIELGVNGGGFVNSNTIETGTSSRHYALDMDSDANYPSAVSVNIGMITAYAGVTTDSLKYFYWNGTSFTSKLIKNSVDGNVGHTHINYANNANFTDGLFFMAWDELKFQAIPFPGFFYEKVFYSSTGSSVFAPGIIPYVQIDNLLANNTNRCYKPYVVSQNNGSNPPVGSGSYGLLHGLIFLRDSIDIYSTNVLGYINNSYSSFTAPATVYNPESNLTYVQDYAAFNWGSEHHIMYFEKSARHLRWFSKPYFIDDPGTAFTDEFIPGGHINDNPSLTENPDPAITVNRLNNSPAFFWIDQVAGKGVVKYDAPYMSAFASVNSLQDAGGWVYPNPAVGNQLHVHLNHVVKPGQLFFSIRDLQGKEIPVSHFYCTHQELTLDISGFTKGMYIISISIEGHLTHQRFIVN
jgi:hypothetical protein